MKQNKYILYLAGLGVMALTIAVVESNQVDINAATPKCADVSLPVDFDSEGKAEKELCFTKNEYKDLKAQLKADYKKNPDYDFDVNNKDLLIAVWNKEIKEKGLQIQNMDKAKLKQTLLDLLN